MRMAFILMAYKDPPQIERLVKKLCHNGFDFYIHIDRKIDITPFLYLEDLPGVFFVKKRVEIGWASYYLTVGIFNSMKEIINSGKEYNLLSVMSAQDYPLKPAEDLYRYFYQRKENNLVDIEADDSDWWNDAMVRINKYDMINFKFKGKYRLQSVMNKILPVKRFPFPYKFYGGPNATWLTLTIPAAKFVIDFFEGDRQFRKFLFFTWGPDEFLVPTLLKNSVFSESVINDNKYRYVDWSAGGAHPRILTNSDFDALMNSGSCMARKFDIKIDTEILNRIDAFHAEHKAVLGYPAGS